MTLSVSACRIYIYKIFVRLDPCGQNIQPPESGG